MTNNPSSFCDLEAEKFGIHLKDSILWLDAPSKSGLSFLSSITQYSSALGPQLLGSEETIALKKSRRSGSQGLSCAFFHPFAIGRLRLELYPSGHVLGGSLLHIESNHRSILYAPAVQMETIACQRPLKWKKADDLVLGAFNPLRESNLEKRADVKAKLLLQISKLKTDSGPLSLILNPYHLAQEILVLLTEAGLQVHLDPHIYSITKIYERFGQVFKKYLHGTKPRPFDGVSLISNQRLPPTPLEAGPKILISDHSKIRFEPRHLSFRRAYFELNAISSASELLPFITQIGPKRLSLFGPYSKEYQTFLSSHSTLELRCLGPDFPLI